MSAKPWAEPNLTPEARARALGLVMIEAWNERKPAPISQMIAEALRAARADALDDAARATCSGCAEGLPSVVAERDGSLRHVMRGGGNTRPCHAEAIRVLKDAP